MAEPAIAVELRVLLSGGRAKLLALARGFRVPPEEAEDLLQNVLLRYLEKRPTIRNPEAWLRRVLRRECLQYLRSRRRRLWETVDTGVLERVAPPQCPEQEAADARRDLESALSRLPDRCRQLLRQRYVLGCRDAEIAAHLGYRSSGVSKLVLRSLRALEAEIGP